MPWVKHSDIMPTVVGSDHCPVYIDLHDEIELEGRGKVSLWDELNPGRTRDGPAPDPPAMAARKMKEFGGGQQLLSSFFRQPAAGSSGLVASRASGSATPPSNPPRPGPVSKKSSSSAPVRKQSNGAGAGSRSPEPSLKWTDKSKEIEVPAQKGQPNLSSFFKPPDKHPRQPSGGKTQTKGKPKAAKSAGDEVLVLKDSSDDEPAKPSTPSSRQSPGASQDLPLGVEEYQYAQAVNAEAASAWSNIFAPKAAPLCTGHQEPAKLMTVNKTGINKGRRFYLCSRWVRAETLYGLDDSG